ncbi:hypothetical protein BUE93_21660 [Chromobacterium amazonense]|uniref:Uncharacterized protein n=1 Tax=Chromobacterium amazonense TaxID=1382803 RepID=A0A2S9WYM3_9NEIS|nr:hypothetical protein BUE93_21660 [Chromobacterium amazonense]
MLRILVKVAMRQALAVQPGQPFRLIGFGGAAAALIEAAAPAFLDHGFAEQVELHADQVIPFGGQIQPAFRFHAPPHDGPAQTACRILNFGTGLRGYPQQPAGAATSATLS